MRLPFRPADDRPGIVHNVRDAQRLPGERPGLQLRLLRDGVGTTARIKNMRLL